jgi:hypothetical protein
MKKTALEISKSQFIRGLQCPLSLWFYRNRKELIPEVPPEKQRIFDMGHEVGLLAQETFPNGVEITEKHYEIEKAIESTQKQISSGSEVLFEATACSEDGAYARIDILKKVRGSGSGMEATWDLIEVKSSTEVKDYQILDSALQRYAFEGAGYKIRKSILMHINNKYERSGELNLKEFFTKADITKEVLEIQSEVKEDLPRLIKIIHQKKEPEIEIGEQCKKPFECEFKYHCWKEIPKPSVYDLFSGKKLEYLLDKSVLEIDEVPDEMDLTDRQRFVVDQYQAVNTYSDKKKLNEFLDQLKYPLYYLDYETIFSAIPLFDKTKPFSQVPFQFSLHVINEEGEEVRHIEYLHKEKSDPRESLVRALCEGIEDDGGSVVVYNQGFEVSINNSLAELFPKYASKLKDINSRVIDLMDPFSKRHLYHGSFLGKYSIKITYPYFVTDPKLKNYKDLEIQDGGSASSQYEDWIRGKSKESEEQKLFENLVAYCELDTLAMVRLLDVIKKYSK